MSETENELARAEEKLKKFRENNLNYYRSTDPGLLLTHERLVRETEVKKQVYLTLAQQYELAAIREKKETPVIQVLDKARPPSLKSGPARSKTTVLGFIIGLLAAAFLVIMDYRFQYRRNDYNFKQFTRKIRFIRRRNKQEIAEHV